MENSCTPRNRGGRRSIHRTECTFESRGVVFDVGLLVIEGHVAVDLLQRGHVFLVDGETHEDLREPVQQRNGQFVHVARHRAGHAVRFVGAVVQGDFRGSASLEMSRSGVAFARSERGN